MIPVVIEGDVPLDYTRTKIEPDMVKIRTALEEGVEVPGAKLGVRGSHVRLR